MRGAEQKAMSKLNHLSDRELAEKAAESARIGNATRGNKTRIRRLLSVARARNVVIPQMREGEQESIRSSREAERLHALDMQRREQEALEQAREELRGRYRYSNW